MIGSRMLKAIAFSPLMFAANLALAGGDVACPTFNQQLEGTSIKMDGDALDINPAAPDYVKVRAFIQTYISDQETGDKKKDKKNKKLKFLKHAMDLIDQAEEAQQGSKEQISSYIIALRAVYSVCAKTNVELDLLDQALVEKLGRGFSLLVGRKKKTKLPYVANNNARMDDDEAMEQSPLLSDPANPTPYYLRRESFENQTYAKVASYDVSEFHPALHTRAYMYDFRTTQSHRFWEQLEADANQAVTYDLVKENEEDIADSKTPENKITNESPYDLHKARRVLFFKNIKTSATSAKIQTKDNFGADWKLKWSTEEQTEVYASRVARAIGYKLVDMVYSNPAGKDGVVLILDEGPDSGPNSCENIATYAKFRSCLLLPQDKDNPTYSGYEFDIDIFKNRDGAYPATGTVKDHPEILEFLDTRGEYSKEDLQDRVYVTFKSSQTEFSGEGFVVRGGPAAFSSVGALNDRFARGSVMFNNWIHNYDAKDENNKAYLMRKFDAAGKYVGKVYVETQHDMGASQGDFPVGKPHPGNANGLEIGDGFFEISDDDEVTFNQRLLYKPLAWSFARHSDNLWGTKLVAELTNQQIWDAVNDIYWPRFAKLAYAYKMQARRDHMADIYKLPHEEGIAAPSMTYKLQTAAQRKQAAEELNLRESDIYEALTQMGYASGSDSNENLAKALEDRVLSRGVIASCENSLLVALLEQHVHPAGISRRLRRDQDNIPLDSSCRPSSLPRSN